MNERLGDQIYDALTGAGFWPAASGRDGFEVLGHLADRDRALVVFRADGVLRDLPTKAVTRRFLGDYHRDLTAEGFEVEHLERDGDVVALLVSRCREVSP